MASQSSEHGKRGRTSKDLASYDVVAPEYYDQVAHPTCYNLNRLSRIFIGRRLPEPWGGLKTLEVGAGYSSVAAILHARGYRLHNIHITDTSAKMLQHSQQWATCGAKLSVRDACSIEHPAGAFDYLVSGLGDPYNTPEFWAAARHALKPGGRMLFTTPSFEWSTRFRGGSAEASRVAEFVLRGGAHVFMPSFIVPLRDQIALMEDAGFMVLAFESLGVEALDATEPRSQKIDVFADEVSSVVWGFELTNRTKEQGKPTARND